MTRGQTTLLKEIDRVEFTRLRGARRERYGGALGDLLARLRKGPLSAREVADKQDCARGTAYARLRALVRLGLVEVVGLEDAPAGPQAEVYQAIDEKAVDKKQEKRVLANKVNKKVAQK